MTIIVRLLGFGSGAAQDSFLLEYDAVSLVPDLSKKCRILFLKNELLKYQLSKDS